MKHSFKLKFAFSAIALAGAAAFGQAADPPATVGLLSSVQGQVSFAPAGTNDWSAAFLNRPMTQGDRVWTDRGARAELHLGSSALRLGAETALNFSVFDDQTSQVNLTQGSLNLHIREIIEGQSTQVSTPNLSFTVAQPGEYRIDVDPARNTTRVTVRSGAGTVYGEANTTINLGSGQQAGFGPGGLLQPGVVAAAPADALDTWASARDRTEEQSQAARYVSRDVVGYQQLDTYGDWRTDPAYGPVWYPRVTAVDWAPYRQGHWDYISPWGWTWVDDAPWGFAPFHYGRWVMSGTRWAWVPGPRERRAVYAPALVAFVGGSSGGVDWSLSVGRDRRPGVAWFPLAPGEAWRPSFAASPAYLARINRDARDHGHDNNNGNRPNFAAGPQQYRYQRMTNAVTAVSADDFTRHNPVRPRMQPLAATELAQARVVTAPPARPAPGRDAGNGPGRERDRDGRHEASAVRPPPQVQAQLAQPPVVRAAQGAAPAAPRPAPVAAAAAAPAVAAVPGINMPRPQGRFDNDNRNDRGPRDRGNAAAPAPVTPVPAPATAAAPAAAPAVMAPVPPAAPPVVAARQREQAQREQAQREQAQKDQAQRVQHEQQQAQQAQRDQQQRAQREQQARAARPPAGPATPAPVPAAAPQARAPAAAPQRPAEQAQQQAQQRPERQERPQRAEAPREQPRPPQAQAQPQPQPQPQPAAQPAPAAKAPEQPRPQREARDEQRERRSVREGREGGG